MERRKFMQTGLLASLLAVIFPKSLMSKNVKPQSSNIEEEVDFIHQYPLTPDEAFEIDGDIEFCLVQVHSPLEFKFEGQYHTGQWRSLGAGGIIKGSKVSVFRSASKYARYRTIKWSYKYNDSDYWINLYIPMTRMLRDKRFKWIAAKPIENSEGTLSMMNVIKDNDLSFHITEGPISELEAKYVIERWDDHIDIHLS